jgi:hypothetical protein
VARFCGGPDWLPVLREGDTITVKGNAVAGMEGDLVVATEVHKGDKSLSLKDRRGQPAW